VTARQFTYEADDQRWAEVSSPRDDLVLEHETQPGTFAATEGPFTRYERRVTAEPTGPGRHQVTEHIEFTLAIPVFGPLFARPALWALGPRGKRGTIPFWAPPDRLSRRNASVLGLLCALSLATGYLGTLLSQTITFAAEEYGNTVSDQSMALVLTRFGVVLSMIMIALADRKGRRRALVGGLQASCLLMATAGLAPNLLAFAGSQTLARGFITAAIVLLGIMAIEEMPASSRAYAVSVMSMAGALGAGMVLWLLPLADLGDAAWRLLYIAPVGWFFAVRALARSLPESQRFERAELTDADDVASHTPEARRSHRERLGLLAASGLLGAIFFTPASQLFNEFLREDRDFEAWRITVFQITTNLPGGIGIVVGGRLADTRGRRLVGSVGLIVGVAATVAMYNVTGWSMWLWSVVGALFGAAVVPALGVYGPELFPTNLRGRANSIITLLGVIGSSAGLLLVGFLAERWGGFGAAVAVVAIGPALLALLVLLFYPETAHRELEEINPEDAVLRDIALPGESPARRGPAGPAL
jgi:MFS family permease